MRRYDSLGFMLAEAEYEPDEVFAGHFFCNPLVLAASGINLIAGACVTMSNAIVLSIIMLVLLPVVGLVASLEDRRLSPAVRPAVYAVISVAVTIMLAVLCNTVVSQSADALGVFLPLAALDTVVFVRISDEAPSFAPLNSMAAGLGTACSFASLALPTALIREFFGGGSIFGKYVFDGVEALQRPFCGFILCGFALAIIKQRSVTRSLREIEYEPTYDEEE